MWFTKGNERLWSCSVSVERPSEALTSTMRKVCGLVVNRK